MCEVSGDACGERGGIHRGQGGVMGLACVSAAAVDRHGKGRDKVQCSLIGFAK